MHGLGLGLGALTASLTLSTIGLGLRGAGLGFVCRVAMFVALAIALRQCAVGRVPQRSWQVPEYWRRHFDLDVLPVAYGAILGTGIFTAVVVGGFWVFVATTAALAPTAALLGWAAYAAGRLIGFRIAVVRPELEALFLTARKRQALAIGTTLLGALVVFS